MSDQEWTLYESCLTYKRLEAKEYFFQAGQVCRFVAFVHSGLVRMFMPADGKEITVDLISEGTFITDYGSFLSRTPSEVSIEALEPTELCLLSHEKMQWLYAHLPQGEKLGRLIAEKLYLQTVERLKSFYAETPEQRYRRLSAQLETLLGRVPQYYVASVLGVVPETLSRIKKRVDK